MTRASSTPSFNRSEWRACISLSSLYALRMLGLFLVFPVLAVDAKRFPGGDDPIWVGIAVGIYGLTQAFLQIPFGLASDRYGRKRVIIIGLLIFGLGSFVAAVSQDIYWLAIGRALQGAGAISAAVTAFLADSTRDEVRTRAMAIIGGTIGLTFALSLVVAPVLSGVLGLEGLFWMTGVLACAAIWPVIRLTDVPLKDRGEYSFKAARRSVLANGQLMRLNLGIFMIHMAQTAVFVVIPLALIEMGLQLSGHWQIYLPVVLLSFLVMVPPILWVERTGNNKFAFLLAIAVMGFAILAFAWVPSVLWIWALMLFLFFLSFNLLEAFLPSWVSRVAPAQYRGLALGVYNTTQAFGLFCGGLLGGAIAKVFGAQAVYAVCALAILIWWLVSTGLQEIGRRGEPSTAA